MTLKKFKSQRSSWDQAEQRDILGLTPMSMAGLARPSAAGVAVNSGTALGIASFAQGVRLIAESVAKTDLFPARRHERGGYTPATDHPTYDLLRHAPNSYANAYAFLSTLVTHAVVAGIGLAQIQRQAGRVVGFHLLDPSFKPEVRGDRVVFRSGVGAVEHDAADVIVIRNISWTGLDALSPVAVARDMLGTRIAETTYAAAMLGNGAQAGGHLEIPGNTNPQQRAEIRQGWNETHQGPQNANNLGILWGGAKFVPTSYSPSDAQLVEGQNFGVAEVSRLLNIPGFMLGVPDAIKPSSTEEGMALFVALTLSAWFRQIQQELDLKLLSSIDRRDLFFWHDTRTLTQGDSRSQVDEAVRLSECGINSLNESRLSIGMNPVDDPRFDHHYIGTNNQQAVETITPGVPTQPGVNHPLPPSPGDTEVKALRSVLADPIARFARTEAEAVRRNAGKPRVDQWAAEFYPKHAAKLAEALAPAVGAVNAVLGTSLDAQAIARSIADESLAELRTLWTTLTPAEVPTRLARWEEDRSFAVADHHLNLAREAI